VVQVRPYRPGDLDALHDICLKTGDGGRDGHPPLRRPRIIGEIFAAPYATLEPQHAFVAEDELGVAGYILGTADTRAFEARLEAEWWPALRARYADTADVPIRKRTREQWDAYYIHHPPPNPQAVVDIAPAHLHIDLLPAPAGPGRRQAPDGHLARRHRRPRPPRLPGREPPRATLLRDLRLAPPRGIGPKSVVWMAFGA
jgi:hypothetical protein